MTQVCNPTHRIALSLFVRNKFSSRPNGPVDFCRSFSQIQRVSHQSLENPDSSFLSTNLFLAGVIIFSWTNNPPSFSAFTTNLSEASCITFDTMLLYLLCPIPHVCLHVLTVCLHRVRLFTTRYDSSQFVLIRSTVAMGGFVLLEHLGWDLTNKFREAFLRQIKDFLWNHFIKWRPPFPLL